MNTSTFLNMLTYRRPAGSTTEETFINKFIRPLGVQQDIFGNLYKQVGESDVLWSSHTDTVHRKEGRQKVAVSDDFVALASTENVSNCLGADCTTGVYIMTEMVKAKVPGLYVFHREEEVGGAGSRSFLRTHEEILKSKKYAIAFDRRGRQSVITHQFDRCCSDDFAHSLADILPTYKLDDTGVFTDTANYTGVIPECSNLSVGYFNEHTKNESQDLKHLSSLISNMLVFDESKLRASRDPNSLPDYRNQMWGRQSWSQWEDDDSEYYRLKSKSKPTFESKQVKREELVDLIRDYPEAVAFVLEEYGFTADDLQQYIYAA